MKKVFTAFIEYDEESKLLWVLSPMCRARIRKPKP